LYFIELGFEVLPKKITFKGKNLDIDQLFKHDNTVYFIEHKVRDDHDSSKKRGQHENFESKVEALGNIYGQKNLKCFVYFTDENFIKNKNYYDEVMKTITNKYKIEAYLWYGKE